MLLEKQLLCKQKEEISTSDQEGLSHLRQELCSEESCRASRSTCGFLWQLSMRFSCRVSTNRLIKKYPKKVCTMSFTHKVKLQMWNAKAQLARLRNKFIKFSRSSKKVWRKSDFCRLNKRSFLPRSTDTYILHDNCENLLTSFRHSCMVAISVFQMFAAQTRPAHMQRPSQTSF